MVFIANGRESLFPTPYEPLPQDIFRAVASRDPTGKGLSAVPETRGASAIAQITAFQLMLSSPKQKNAVSIVFLSHFHSNPMILSLFLPFCLQVAHLFPPRTSSQGNPLYTTPWNNQPPASPPPFASHCIASRYVAPIASVLLYPGYPHREVNWIQIISKEKQNDIIGINTISSRRREARQ